MRGVQAVNKPQSAEPIADKTPAGFAPDPDIWRRRRVMGLLSGGNAHLLALHLIAERPRSGFALADAMESLGSGAWRPDARDLYADLGMLADEGYVRTLADESGRKTYAVKESGKAYLATRQEAVKSTLERIKRECDTHGRPGPVRGSFPLRHQVSRLADTLKLALRARLAGKEVSGDGNALRASVLGANDGLVSNLSLVMGMVGASASSHTVVIAGSAGLIAGACSMALGEWLSVNNARENYQLQLKRSEGRRQETLDSEQRELAIAYQARGLSEADATAFAQLMQEQVAELDQIVHEQLGLNDPDKIGGSPLVAAISSFSLFAAGAAMPVVPYLFVSGGSVHFASLAVSVVALAAIGLVTSRFTGRKLGFSASRQVPVGMVAAAITFGMGHLAGMVIG